MIRHRLDAEVNASESLLLLLRRARRLVNFYETHGIALPSALRRLLGEPLPDLPAVTDEKVDAP